MMTKFRINDIFNFLLFQTQWLLCVVNIHHGFYYAFGLFLLQLIFLDAHKFKLKILLVFILSLIGVLFDSVLMHGGVLLFPEGNAHLIIPAWLSTLWLCFSLWFVKAEYINQKILTYTILCVIFGPFSYYIGMKLGALMFGVSLIKSLILISFNWFILSVLFVNINKALLKKST